MCLAIPMIIKNIDGNLAKCELNGVEYTVRIDLIDNPDVGEYVIVHAGVGIQKIDEKEVEELVKIYQEMNEALEEDFSQNK